MKFIGLVFILFMSVVVLVILGTMLLSVKRRIKGISKDYAEQIAMRRYGQGHVIGARFTRVGTKWVWEFDVRDGEAIHRIWVDARAAIVLKAVDLTPSERYFGRPGQFLGKRIG